MDPLGHRRSIRLRGYDYSRPGVYFLTICTYQGNCLFGHVKDGVMKLNEIGILAETTWQAIPQHFIHVTLGTWVVMPNHIHGIVIIDREKDADGKEKLTNNPPKRLPHGTSKTVGSIVRGFKIGVTKEMRKRGFVGPVWKRNYWEHIVRGKDDLARIREYIQKNPESWAEDQWNLTPDNISMD